MVGAARVDPLRGEGEEEVDADGASAGGEGREELLAGRAGVGGRLEHDQLPGLQVRGDRRGGVAQVGEVGLAGARERRRDAEDDRLAVLQVGVVAGGARRSAGRRQLGVVDVLDVAAARGQVGELGGVGVEADDLVPGLGEGEGERKSDVAEADDPQLHRGGRVRRRVATTDSAASRVCQVGSSGMTYQSTTASRASAISCENQ